MAAALLESSTGTMEALFRPTTRYRSRGRWLPAYITEVELLPGLTIENVLASGVTWEDFQRFLRDNKIVWMTPDVYVCSRSFGVDDPRVLGLEGGFGTHMSVYVTQGTAEACSNCDLRLYGAPLGSL
jgi:hypothetical protein